MATEINMLDLIRQLQAARSVYEVVHQEIAVAHEIWEAEFIKKHEGAKGTLNRAYDEMTALDQQIRQLACAAYSADPSIGKSPYPGIGIQEPTTYGYNDADALNWAIEHRQCLALDKKAFGEVCKSDALRPGFVGAAKSVKATIATDLAKALGEG